MFDATTLTYPGAGSQGYGAGYLGLKASGRPSRWPSSMAVVQHSCTAMLHAALMWTCGACEVAAGWLAEALW